MIRAVAIRSMHTTCSILIVIPAFAGMTKKKKGMTKKTNRVHRPDCFVADFSQ